MVKKTLTPEQVKKINQIVDLAIVKKPKASVKEIYSDISVEVGKIIDEAFTEANVLQFYNSSPIEKLIWQKLNYLRANMI